MWRGEKAQHMQLCMAATIAGNGVTFMGRPLVDPGGNQPIYFGRVGEPGDPVDFMKFPGYPLRPDVPLNIVNRPGVPVRNDNGTTPAYLGSGNGTSLPEQYTPYHPGDIGSTEPIQPGSPVLLRNRETGALGAAEHAASAACLGGLDPCSRHACCRLQARTCRLAPRLSRAAASPNPAGKYCRLIPVPTAPAMLGMQCDLDTPNAATPFQYTGARTGPATWVVQAASSLHVMPACGPCILTACGTSSASEVPCRSPRLQATG
jgi:hypothetical protein